MLTARGKYRGDNSEGGCDLTSNGSRADRVRAKVDGEVKWKLISELLLRKMADGGETKGGRVTVNGVAWFVVWCCVLCAKGHSP